MWTNFGRVYWTEILSEVGVEVNDYLFLSFLFYKIVICVIKKKVNFNCNSVTGN